MLHAEVDAAQLSTPCALHHDSRTHRTAKQADGKQAAGGCLERGGTTDADGEATDRKQTTSAGLKASGRGYAHMTMRRGGAAPGSRLDSASGPVSVKQTVCCQAARR